MLFSKENYLDNLEIVRGVISLLLSHPPTFETLVFIYGTIWKHWFSFVEQFENSPATVPSGSPPKLWPWDGRQAGGKLRRSTRSPSRSNKVTFLEGTAKLWMVKSRHIYCVWERHRRGFHFEEKRWQVARLEEDQSSSSWQDIWLYFQYWSQCMDSVLTALPWRVCPNLLQDSHFQPIKNLLDLISAMSCCWRVLL